MVSGWLSCVVSGGLVVVMSVLLNQVPQDQEAGTHVLRHSAARHRLSCGVPINAVSLWLGHSHLETTLIYLRLLPDPQSFMDRVV